MLENLVDPAPILEVLHGCLRRSEEVAEAEGVDLGDPRAVHDWVLSRLEAEDSRKKDSFVTRAVSALVMLDASRHSLDLEHDPRERYAWDLASELVRPGPDGTIPGVPAPVGWYAVVGRFECAGLEYEVRVPGEGGGDAPHVRVSRASDPSIPDVCVALYRPAYLPDGLHRWELDQLHRSALDSFLGQPADGTGSGIRWELAAGLWHRFRGGRRDAETMPAYEWLRWEGGARDGL